MNLLRLKLLHFLYDILCVKDVLMRCDFMEFNERALGIISMMMKSESRKEEVIFNLITRWHNKNGNP